MMPIVTEVVVVAAVVGMAVVVVAVVVVVDAAVVVVVAAAVAVVVAVAEHWSGPPCDVWPVGHGLHTQRPSVFVDAVPGAHSQALMAGGVVHL